MDSPTDALNNTLTALNTQIEKSSNSYTIVSSCLTPVMTRIDKILTAIALAPHQEKDTITVCVDELSKLRGDLMATLSSEQGALRAIAGQRSGINAAIEYLESFHNFEEEEEERKNIEEESVQRTKERIQSGDLKLDRPRSLGDRPETLKNVRKAQQEIKEEEASETPDI